jgi:filamentous hemagglutinin family protein
MREASTIDGILRTNNPLNMNDPLNFGAANLYLVNPAGVIFGPNGTLDVKGSFAATTADYLRLTDGARFHTELAQPTVLSVAPVAAFGFTAPRPVSISIQRSVDGFLEGADLSVSAGKTLSLVGGDIAITADPILGQFSISTISAPSGLIQLASAKSPGEVPANVTAFDVRQAGPLGEITVAQGALINAAGDGGGTVIIRGGRLSLDGAFIFADNLGPKNGASVGVDASLSEQVVLSNEAAMTADNVGAGKSGDVLLRAPSIELTSSSLVGARPFAAGQGGNVTVMTENLMMSDVGQVITSSSGDGAAGNIDIRASGEVNIESFAGPFFGFSGLFSQSFGQGNAGRISVASPSVTLTEGRMSAEAVSSGRAGDIDLEVGSLSLSSGARILAAPASLNSTGQGGRISIQATDSVLIQGRDLIFSQVSGIFNDTFGSKNAGPVVISTPLLEMSDGRIQAGTLGVGNGADISVAADLVSLTNGALIRTPTLGLGNGGNLNLTARSLEITGGASLSSFTDRSGHAGNITVHALESLVFGGPDARGNASGIGNTASPGSTGNAGNVTIDSPVIAVNGGRVTTASSGSGNAGNITIQAGALMLDQGGTLTASTEGNGAGGNIQVSGRQVSLANDAQLVSSTSGSGRAGNITVNVSEAVTMSTGSVIGSNGFGNGDLGEIQIAAKSLHVTEDAGISSSSLLSFA